MVRDADHSDRLTPSPSGPAIVGPAMIGPATTGAAAIGADVSPALAEAQDRFVAIWGQMGSTWGISRTMAEAHALLYITGKPLCTDDVMDRLRISRGSASMSLRSLLDWGIIRRAHKRGDRKEYFEAEQDVWVLLKAVVRERMKREVQPVLASLFEIRDLTHGLDGTAIAGVKPSPASSAPTGSSATDRTSDRADAALTHNQRLDAMIGLLQLFDQGGERFVQWPTDQLRETAQALIDATASPS